MKLKRTMIMTALAGVLMASCVRENVEPESYDRFYLNPPQFCGDSKLSIDHNGLWWDGLDVIYINGKDHVLFNENGVWHTEGEPVESVNGKFYVGISPAEWDESALRYGPYNFVDDQIIPLAIAGTTNRLTLWPCCAVIRTTQYQELILEDIWSGAVARSGYVYPGESLASCRIVTEEDPFGPGESLYPIVGEDGAYYFVLPIVGDEDFEAILNFDWDVTTLDAVVIKKGYFYDLG